MRGVQDKNMISDLPGRIAGAEQGTQHPLPEPEEESRDDCRLVCAGYLLMALLLSWLLSPPATVLWSLLHQPRA